MPELTQVLQKIFYKQLSVSNKNGTSDASSKQEHSQSLLQAVNSNAATRVSPDGYAQLHNVSLSLANTADIAIRQAFELIQRAMENMDRFAGFSNNWASSIENEMRLAEAELSAVSDSIKSTLENVFRQSSPNSTDDVDSFDISISQVDGSLSEKSAHRVHNLLLHVERILEEERTAVAAARIQLTLCREELREFKNRQLFYSCGAVKSLDEGLWSSLLLRNSDEQSPQEHKLDVGSTLQQCQMLDSSTPLPTAMQLRMVTGSKMLLESVVKRVSNTVKEADDAFTRQLRKAAGVRSDECGAAEDLVLPTPKDNFFLPLRYTPEEESQLLAQHVVLEERQRKVLADDAVAVEVAVRDLSHLNSLVSEAVLSQREKFMILVRNTEDAQLSMKKAVEELEKPLQSFWNPKRQLIALLWFCISIIWAANWLIK